jgi:hypothetical protein
MSLIRVRRERRELSGSGLKKPPTAAKLLILLVLVAVAIWWMEQLGG